MDYYSARLLILCLVDDGELKSQCTCDYPFIVFKAKDYEEAFSRALQLGAQQETVYKNQYGQDVRWVFKEIENIRRLGPDPDGIEVGSLLDVFKFEAPVAYSHKFDPSMSTPMYDDET